MLEGLLLHVDLRAMLNAGSQCNCSLVRGLSCVLSIVNSKDKNYACTICNDNPYYFSKLKGDDYIMVNDDHLHFLCKIENEDGIKTEYILHSEEDGKRSFNTFRKVTSAIMKKM